MTTTTRPAVDPRPAAPGTRPVRSWTGDLITSLCAGWLVSGLFLDGWAHINVPELETFFTPWHAVFYSGFLALAASVCWPIVRAYRQGRRGLAAVPVGYGLGAVGAGIFAVGGVGDLTWHTIFGIEKDIAALLSPTHLVLLTGALLLISSPLRSALATRPATMTGTPPGTPGGVGPSLRAFLPTLLSTTLTAAPLCFFFLYLSYFRHLARTGEFAGRSAAADGQVVGIAALLVTALLLISPLLYLARRWRLPFGAVTLHVTLLGLAMTALDSFSHWPLVVWTFGAGLVGDAVLAGAGTARWRYRLAAMVLPAALLAAYFGYLATTGGVGWAPELWAGVTVMSALMGLGVSLLVGEEAA